VTDTFMDGRYRHFPIAGAICATAGMALPATMNAGTTWPVASLYMFVLGAGIGLAVQVMVLVVQNSVPYRDLGAATSSVVLFRQAGSSIGVSLTDPVHQQAGRADRRPPRRHGQYASQPCLVDHAEYGNPPAGRTPASDHSCIRRCAAARLRLPGPAAGRFAVVLAIALPEKPLRGRAYLAADEARLDGKTTSRTARSRHAEGIG